MATTFRALYQCCDCGFEEVAGVQPRNRRDRPSWPLTLGHLCIGCGSGRVPLIKELSEVEFSEWKEVKGA